MENNFDIIIIGGGHAGSEAAWIATQFGLKIALISSPNASLASAPCNPAIGGVGKGQVVREIDALGGLMGILADKAGIQFRTLNESKGFAVQSTRVQVDKELYTNSAEALLGRIDNLEIVRKMVLKVEKINELFRVTTSDLSVYCAKKIVVTTGTFLNGKLHTGEEQKTGGRVDCQNSGGLNDLFSDIKTLPNRFKTGTPPRLDKTTIDYKVMDPQLSDSNTRNFSSLHLPFHR